MKTVLDVGCGDARGRVPAYYDDWRRVRLDIDPRFEPEILLDARQLQTLPAESYDAVYCSHNLEHYHRHDGLKVVAGIRHVLKPNGFFELRVPDLAAVMATGLDVDDVLYHVGDRPILVRDVIYGWHVPIEQTGDDFYAHKTGFSLNALLRFVAPLGFPQYAIGPGMAFELRVWFFPQIPSEEINAMLRTATPE